MSIKEVWETAKDLYIEKDVDRNLQELCRSLEPEREKFNVAIVVLGSELRKFSGVSGQEYIKGNLLLHMREAAAAIKFKELENIGLKPIIIVSGGKIYGKENEIPALAEIAKKEINKKYNIDPEKIIAQPFSIDTSQEARHNPMVLKSLGFLGKDKDINEAEKDIFVVTNQFHVNRASELFHRHESGKISMISAEDVLIEFAKNEKYPYQKINLENIGKQHKTQEELAKILTKLPMGEKLLEFVAAYLRRNSGAKEIPSISKKDKYQ